MPSNDNKPFTDIAAVNAMFAAHFPDNETRAIVTEMRDGFAALELKSDARHLRPGNMVSGPTQMALADTVAYVVVFTKLGITPMAVTSNLNMHFLRPCLGPLVRAEGTLLRIGKTSATIEVRIFGEGHSEPSSFSTVAYALPK
ncbi:thioesterase [Litorimonas cladophorae]|uniref:Thioesterase n=1 Tax=Litorimonas cladophorae TaxID=1220491 RepID=A0A918KQM3_9PROT|nr:PaaI family thioesterase [Litorimonas cladophorae]GGX69694.1 thioesterase [Litorimonas cladophorae]